MKLPSTAVPSPFPLKLDKMTVPKHRKIRLRALTPVHIGTGEELTPLDYVVLKEGKDYRFYHLGQEGMLNFVREQKKAPQFASWISKRYALMRDSPDNRTLSTRNLETNPYEFCRDEQLLPAFRSYLADSEQGIFQARVVQPRVGRGSTDNRSIALGQVRRAIKNHRGQPLLPGTSIKGALRTAVFYHYLCEHADSREVERVLIDQLSERTRKERFALPLIHRAFFCGIRDLETKRTKWDDEKMDLFKLLGCADAHLANGQSDALELAKVNIYVVEKKRGNYREAPQTIAVQQSQTAYCENIKAGAVLETELRFDIEFLLQLKGFLQGGSVLAGQQMQWLGIEEKVEQLFGIQLAELTADNKEAMRQRVFDHLYACLGRFNADQLSVHEAWLARYGEHDKRNNYTSQIEKGFAPVFGSSGQSMLHLGYATGFTGTTALEYFLADEKRKALFKQVMEKFNLGNKPGNRGRYSPNPDLFPKSRRLVDLEDRIAPMGWLQLFPDDGSPLPQLQTHTQSRSLSGHTQTGQTQTQTSNPSRSSSDQTQTQTPHPPSPRYLKNTPNHKKRYELDAEVAQPGQPNQVRVFVREDNTPTLPLNGYRGVLKKGEEIIVMGSFSKKGKLVQVTFKKRR